MSGKRHKQQRSLIKKMEETARESESLFEAGQEFFEDPEKHEEWFSSACYIKALSPDISEEILMPTVLPLFLYDQGTIDKDEVWELLPDLLLEEEIKKIEEYLDSPPRNQLF